LKQRQKNWLINEKEIQEYRLIANQGGENANENAAQYAQNKFSDLTPAEK